MDHSVFKQNKPYICICRMFGHKLFVRASMLHCMQGGKHVEKRIKIQSGFGVFCALQKFS